MNKSRRTALLVLTLTLSASAIAYVGRPTVKLADKHSALDLETMIPAKFGEWRVDETIPVLLPAPNLLETLNKTYNQVLARTYVNPQGERIMLSIAYGGDQSDGTKAHWPESCYRAQGFAMISSKVEGFAFESGGKDQRVRRLVTKAGARNEPITYWIVVGDELALSSTEQKLAQLRYGVRGLIPDGMLVRISSIDRDSNQAYKVQDRFLRDLYAAVNPADRVRFFGSVH